MHLSILPLTLVARIAGGISKLTVSMEDIVLELTFINAAILAHLLTAWTFLASLVETLILPAIIVLFFALSVWLVV